MVSQSLVCSWQKAAGARTIITSASDDKLAFVQKRYGADHVINYKTTPSWAAEAKKLTGGEGVDHIFENGGSGTIAQSLDSIKMEGTISVIGFLTAAKHEDMPDVAGLALSKGMLIFLQSHLYFLKVQRGESDSEVS